MGITRRRFLGCAAGAVTAGLPLDLWRRGRGRSSLAAETSPKWVLLDLKEHGSLGESVSGYESALASLGAGGGGGGRVGCVEAAGGCPRPGGRVSAARGVLP